MKQCMDSDNLHRRLKKITGILGPMLGALVHNCGSVFVITNSAVLLRWSMKIS